MCQKPSEREGQKSASNRKIEIGKRAVGGEVDRHGHGYRCDQGPNRVHPRPGDTKPDQQIAANLVGDRPGRTDDTVGSIDEVNGCKTIDVAGGNPGGGAIVANSKSVMMNAPQYIG
jgi:hypothetical protein